MSKKNPRRRRILPLLAALEPRTLFSISYSDADLSGFWALNGMSAQGSVSFDGAGNLNGGQILDSDGSTHATLGTYSVSPSGGVSVTSNNAISGGMNASKNLVAINQIRSSENSSKDLTILTQSGSAPFASTDADGTWFIFYNGAKSDNPDSTSPTSNSGHGVFAISQGTISGTASDDETNTLQDVFGSATVGQGGDLTLTLQTGGAAANAPGAVLNFAGELNSTKDVAVLNPDLVAAAQNDSSRLFVMIKPGSNATSASVAGTWRMVSDDVNGTVTFDGNGNLTGNVVTSDGATAITGTYAVDSGSIAAIVQAGSQTITFAGAVNTSGDVIAMDQPNSGSDGIDDMVILTNPETTVATPVGNPLPTPQTITPGNLDPNFGTGGVATTAITGPAFTLVASSLQPDGKIVEVGDELDGGLALLRFNTDGSPDTSFGDGSGVFRFISTADHPTSLALQSDGSILVAGTINGDFELRRFTASGTPDSSFGNAGLVTTDFGGTDRANAITVGSDGKIYLAGTTDASNGGDFAVSRYNSDGSADGSFNGTGKQTIDFAGASDSAATISIQRDGKLIVAGSATVNGNLQAAAARLTTSGQLDSTFATAGKFLANTSAPSAFSASAITPDNKIVLGGFTAHGTLGGSDFGTNFFLTRLQTTGKIDTKFGSKGSVSTAIPDHSLSAINQLLVLSDDSILSAGKAGTALGDADANNLAVAITKYTSTGALDTGFNSSGILLLFQPGTSQSQGQSAPGDLTGQFNDFINASVGLVDLTQGGGILALASSPDTTNNSTTVSIAEITPSGADLSAQSLVLSKVPASVLGGAKGGATLTITNTGSAAIKESVPVTIYISADPNYFGQSIATTHVSLNLKPHTSKKLSLKFNFPSNVDDGAYYVVAGLSNTNDINATDDTTITHSTTTVAHPFVDLAASFSSLPSSLSATAKDKITLLLTNNGNVTAKGSSQIQLLLSDDAAIGNDTTLLNFAKSLSIAPGKFLKLTLSFTPGVTSGTADFLAATVSFPSDSNTDNNTTFSTSAITFN